MTAYAFNKPVVASSVGGIPEVVTDNVTGTLVPARNPRALAEAIIDLLLNRGKRARMKKNIEKECLEGKLSWDNVAKETIEVYQKAIERYKV
jgi:glycosyltransferase involved in cell wall biosynthesis